jgi:hypothetical protein
MTTTAQENENLQLMWAFTTTFPDYPSGFIFPAALDHNYVPPNRARFVMLVGTIGISLATFIVILRLAIRMCYKHARLGMDDILIIPALVSLLLVALVAKSDYLNQITSIAFVVSNLISIPLTGLGHHTYDNSYSQLLNGQKVGIQ